MTPAEFRHELIALSECVCVKRGRRTMVARHDPDCHADESWVEDFDRVLAAVRSHERERCASTCEQRNGNVSNGSLLNETPAECADAIRALDDE